MPFRVISVALTGSTGDLSAALRSASRDVGKFDSETRRSASNVTKSTSGMTAGFRDVESVLSRGVTRSLIGFSSAALGGYAAGRALNAALQDLIGGAVQFDARMRNVNSISGLSEAQLRSLGSQVIGLSKELPQSANLLAEGLYDIASSGFQGAQGVTVLTASARAATAGLTDTATSAQAIAGVLNAYGEGATRARFVSDSLFQTVNLGVLSFSDLAQGIGQVVGTASAAGVNIDQLGQAVATMTKAGIVPAEAFTSLNQVLAQIIQPSVGLSKVFAQLGYQSGATALQTKGLAGVIDDIRRATGGDITTLSTLFTDIRSLRGVLALTANQGQLYAGVIRDWSVAHKGAGATAVALAEQMKSVSAQWDLFKNRVHAAAIEAGTRLLPTILDLLQATRTLGHDGFGTLDDAVGRLAPFFRAVRDIGGDLARIFGDLFSAVEPLGRAMLGIASAGLITALNTLSTSLAAVFNFIDHNRTTVEVLAGLIATLLLPSVVNLTVAFNRMVLTPLVYALVTPFLLLARAVTTGTGLVRGLTAAMTTLATVEGAVTVGLIAVTAIAAVGFYRIQQAAQDAREKVDNLTEGFNPNHYATAMKTLGLLRDEIGSTADKLDHFRGTAGKFRAGWNTVFGDHTVAQANALNKEAGKQFDQLSDKLLNTVTNAARVGQEVGLTGNEVIRFAEKNNIDLSKPWALAQDAVVQVRNALKDAQTQSGLTGTALKDAAGGDITAIQDLAKAVSDAEQQVSQTFASASDVISLFDPSKSSDAVATATKQLHDAEQSLSDLRARQATDKKQTVSDEQALAHARQAVAEATSNVAKAQRDAQKTGSLKGAYDAEISAGRSFVENIRTVIERGLDPQLVERLLKAGPEKAAPVLQALVQDHSNRLIQMANRSEATLRRINTQIVEITRLTTLAVQSSTDRLTRDLPKALDLEAALRKKGGDSLDALLKALHLSPSQLRRLATEFGITLPKAIQAELDKHPVHVKVGGPAAGPGQRRVPDGRFAAGGLATGPGTGTSDSIPAWLSNGEYVVRASVVQQPGMLPYLNALNRFADGGYVGAAPAAAAVAPKVIVQPVIVRHETNIGELRPHNYDEFAREVATRHRTRRAVER